MKTALVLGIDRHLSVVLSACAQAGIQAERPGRIGPGERAVVIASLTTLRSLATNESSVAELTHALKGLLIAVIPGPATAQEIRWVSELGGICVPEDCLPELPVLLRRTVETLPTTHPEALPDECIRTILLGGKPFRPAVNPEPGRLTK